MTPRRRIVYFLLGLLVLAVGLGSLNYTTESKAEFHRDWAREMKFPEPSPTIFYTGLVCTTLGAGVAGFALGRRRVLR